VHVDRTDAILEQLRQAGGRLTTARRAMIATLVSSDAHLTAEDLAAAVQGTHPDIHRSTVYRCLEALEQLGIVDHTHLGHGPAVYHLADDQHHHLVCEACGAVVELDDAIFEDLRARLQVEHRFTIRPHHFAVPGRCAACS